MSPDQIIILSVLAVYFLGMVAMGFIGGAKETEDDFIIASRNVGVIPTAAAMAASFRDGMGVVFWFGIAATMGYGGIWLFVGVMVGMIMYASLGPAMRKMAAENNFITIGEVIRRRIGVQTERLTGLIIVAMALILVAAQLYVAGHVFARALALPSEVGIVTVALVAAFYLCLGGYSNVIKTDVVQFFIMLSLISIPFLLPPPVEKVMAFDTFSSMGLKTSIVLGLVGFLFVWCTPDSWQRIFSSRNDKTIRTAFPLAAVFLLVLTASLLFLGMATSPLIPAGISSDLAFYELFNPDFLHPGLQAYIAVVTMAVCMSTLSPACYVSASTIARNFLPPEFSRSKAKYIKLSRVVMLIIMVVTSIAAMMIGNVIEFLFGAMSLMYTLFPVILIAVMGLHRTVSERNDRFVTLSTLISLVVYVCMFSTGMMSNLVLTLVPVGLNIVLTGLAVLYSRTRSHAKA